MNGRGRWFRDGEWPIWGWDSSSSEWHRLERACGLTGASLVAMAIRPVETERAVALEPAVKVRRPSRRSGRSRTQVEDEAVLLRALASGLPSARGVLVRDLRWPAHRYRCAVNGLERRGLVSSAGSTVKRFVVLTEAGKAALVEELSGQRDALASRIDAEAPEAEAAPGPVASSRDAGSVAPEAVMGVAEAAAHARNVAVIRRLQTGKATFDQLLGVLPSPADPGERVAALKATLRRLVLRRQVADLGEQWVLVG